METDELEPTEELINGDSEIVKAIASQVKGWAGNWDAVFDNIKLRAMIKEEIVDTAKKFNKPEVLEAEFNALSNHMFHKFSDDVRGEIGLPESEKVFSLWKQWLYEKISE